MFKQGDKIHASVQWTLIYKFQEVLKEDETYHYSYLGVGTNGGDVKTISHQFHLNFQYHTSIKPTQCDSIPRYGFGDVLYNDLDTSFLVGKQTF